MKFVEGVFACVWQWMVSIIFSWKKYALSLVMTPSRAATKERSVDVFVSRKRNTVTSLRLVCVVELPTTRSQTQGKELNSC